MKNIISIHYNDRLLAWYKGKSYKIDDHLSWLPSEVKMNWEDQICRKNKKRCHETINHIEKSFNVKLYWDDLKDIYFHFAAIVAKRFAERIEKFGFEVEDHSGLLHDTDNAVEKLTKRLERERHI